MIEKKYLNMIATWIDSKFYIWSPTENLPKRQIFKECYQHLLSSFDSLVDTENNLEKKIYRNNLLLKNRRESVILSECVKIINKPDCKFGKVSLWKLMPCGVVGIHKDVYKYHNMIDRYILNINMNNTSVDIIVNNKKINSSPGDIITFNHSDPHSVQTKQDDPIYFLSFDLFKK